MISSFNSLEVSLPCYRCGRNNRTIGFRAINRDGICTPENKCSGFDGKILDLDLQVDSVSFLIVMKYIDFIDGKTGLKSSFEDKWCRIGLNIMCGKCGFHSYKDAQSNIIGKLVHKCSACSKSIFSENTESYIFNVASNDVAADSVPPT